MKKREALREGDVVAYCTPVPPKGEPDNKDSVEAARDEWWALYFAAHANGYNPESEYDPMSAGFGAYFTRLVSAYELTPTDVKHLSYDIQLFSNFYLSIYVPAEDVFEAHPEQFACVGRSKA